MRRLAGTGAAALAATLLIAATGCSGGSKAGGSSEHHVSVLTLVSHNPSVDPPLQVYADAVARRSHGALRINVAVNYRPNDTNAETHLIRATQNGAVQIGWVGSRAWENVGIHGFSALAAPFLIDSYPLEQNVLSSSLTRQMLGSLRRHGLVGLAVLPGPLRRVDGRKPLLHPADFRGIVFGTSATPTARATMRALGARQFSVLPTQSASELPSNLGGLDNFLSGLYGNATFTKLPYISMNVNLWPRPLVVFANAKVYDSLSPAQQQALRLAGADALAQAMSPTRSDDISANGALCSAKRVGFPVRLLTATPSELATLRRAVQPVYTMLERDPQTRTLIARIERLKHRLGVPADAGRACRRGMFAPVRRPTLIDGIYRQHVTVQQMAAFEHVRVSDVNPGDYGYFVWVYDRDRFAFTQRSDGACAWAYGRFVLRKNWINQLYAGAGAFGGSQAKPGDTWNGRWSLYRNVLSIDAPQPGPPPMRLTRVSTTPSRRLFFVSKHCRLPDQALR